MDLNEILTIIDNEQNRVLRNFQERKLKRSEVDSALESTTNIKLEIIRLKRSNK